MNKNKIKVYISFLVFLIMISIWLNIFYKKYKFKKNNFNYFKNDIVSKINDLNKEINIINNRLQLIPDEPVHQKKIVKNFTDSGYCLNQIVETLKNNNVKIINIDQSVDKVSIYFNSYYREIYNALYFLNEVEYLIIIENVNISRASENSNILKGIIEISYVKI